MSISSDVLSRGEKALYQLDNSKGMAFDSHSARIFHIDDDGLFTLIDYNRDVYDLLDDDDVATDLSKANNISIGVLTYGWAAPITEDDDYKADDALPPSQHPDKKRVRVLVTACDHGKFLTFLRFESDPDTVETQGGGEGSMADAIQQLINKIQTKKAGNK
jgi:hypothetical protein